MKTLYFFLLVLISSSAFSQLSSYNIADYLYPDVQRKTLMLRPIVDFNSSSSSINGGSVSDFDGSIDLLGSDFMNSRKRQLRLSYNLELGFTARSNNNPSLLNQDGLYGGASATLTNRFFFKPKRFFEIDLSGSFGYDNFFRQFTTAVNRNEITADITIAPKIGFGRLEFVTDAWHAVTILEELQAAGCLSKDLDHAEITLLAKKISELQNYRDVDFRLERIYEFEQLATYLVSEGYMDAANYKSFAILKDAYDFEGFVTRENGQQFTAGLLLTYDYLDENFSAPRTQLSNTIAALVAYERNKAISVDWQFEQRYELQAGIRRFSPLTTEIVDQSNFIHLSSTHTLGYFLSQRTNFELDLNLRYDLFDINIQSTNNLTIWLSPKYNYYLSPQLRFFANGFLAVFSTDNVLFVNNSSDISSSLFAGINYFFY